MTFIETIPEAGAPAEVVEMYAADRAASGYLPSEALVVGRPIADG